MLPLHPHDPPAIGPYRLLGRLSADDTAHRYVGHGPGAQASVTIVLLRPGSATEPGFRAEFTRRVEALRRLKSPYVCPVADADTRGPAPWVAFTRPGEETLADLVEGNQGALPPQDFPAVSAALATGLADLHGAGVPLGVLHAQNVLLVSGTAVLAEAIAAEPVGDDAEDVYHWAVLMSSITGDAGPPLRFRKLLDGCLHPDPALRPTAHELVRMLAGAGPEPEGRAVPVPERRSRRRALPAVAAGSLALAAVIATVFVVTRDDRAEPSGAPDVVTTDCVEAEGFAPADERDSGELDIAHMEFSPDGDLLAVSAFHLGVSVWDWREGREVARLSEGGHDPGSIAFLPEGCVIAAAVPDPRSDEEPPHQSGTVFDLAAGTSTELRRDSAEGEPAEGESPSLHRLAVSPDGLIALTSWGDDRVHIVDQASGEPGGGFGKAIGFEGSDPAFIDDQRLVLTNLTGSRQWSITVWDVRTDERLHTVRPASHSAFAPIPETDRIAYVYGDEVILWDLALSARVEAFTVNGFTETQDPGGVELVADPWFERVYITWTDTDQEDLEYHGGAWDLETGEDVLPEDLAPQLVAPHPNGEVVAVKTEEGDVRFLDPETWETVGTL